MINLPPPTALLESIKVEQPRQLERINTEQSLSHPIGGLAIDMVHDAQLDKRMLPSIHRLLSDYPTTDRHLSGSIITSQSSGSPTSMYSRNDLTAASPTYYPEQTASRRLQQVYGQVSGQYPYPTPHASPVLNKEQHSFASRRSPRHWRYAESSDSMDHYSTRSRQSSESCDSEKSKPKVKKDRNKKAEREYCGRQELSGWMANLHNITLALSPQIASLAAPRPGVPSGGWRPLKSNNINKELMENPLLVNKTDVLASACLVLEQIMAYFKQDIEDAKAEGDLKRAAELTEFSTSLGCAGLRLPSRKTSPNPCL